MLVKLFASVGGDEFGVVGVIAATVITNLTICHIVEPYVLYRHAFQKPVKKHLIKNYCYVAVFIAVLFVMTFVMQTNDNQWIELLTNGAISVGISIATTFVVFLFNKNIRNSLKIKSNRR